MSRLEDCDDALTMAEAAVERLTTERDLARVQYAKAALAEDILRAWLDGTDNGYPLSDGSFEGDVLERARAALNAEWTIVPPSPTA